MPAPIQLKQTIKLQNDHVQRDLCTVPLLATCEMKDVGCELWDVRCRMRDER